MLLRNIFTRVFSFLFELGGGVKMDPIIGGEKLTLEDCWVLSMSG